MASGPEPSSLPAKHPVTADELEIAERRVSEARERAAHAALSAAHSFEKTARLQEEIARIEDQTIEQGAARSDRLRASVERHRHDAAEDRALAERKRREAESCLRPETSE